MVRDGFQIDVDDGVGGLVCRGELDLSAVTALRGALDRACQDDRVVVDLRQVTFLDSSAAEVLLDLVDQGTIPMLRGPRPFVRRVLELVGLGAFLVPEG